MLSPSRSRIPTTLNEASLIFTRELETISLSKVSFESVYPKITSPLEVERRLRPSVNETSISSILLSERSASVAVIKTETFSPSKPRVAGSKTPGRTNSNSLNQDLNQL